MGTFEKFLDKLGFEIVDEEDIENEEAAAPEVENDDYAARKSRKTKEERRQEIAHTSSNIGRGDLFVVEPVKRSDAKIVCDELKEGKTVVVYVETMDVAETTRLYDFIQGSVYALGGKIQQISENVIVVAPKGTDIQTSDNEGPRGGDYSYVEDDELDYGY